MEVVMGFPDRIERTVRLAHPPETVWAALTTADGLGTWFGDSAHIDLRPGGSAGVSWPDGSSAQLRVERVEPPSAFGFTWRAEGIPEDDPRRTYVEFTLEPEGAQTVLTVVETGFAQLSDEAHKLGYHAHVEGWARELGELSEYLDAA